jgi:hypothetical protein
MMIVGMMIVGMVMSCHAAHNQCLGDAHHHIGNLGARREPAAPGELDRLGQACPAAA